MNSIELKFKIKLYPKEAIMKAAYSFIDKCYLHVDMSNDDYIVEITAKDNTDIEEISLEFENELLAQTIRYQVFLQTHTIREVLMARAMASTMIGSNTELENNKITDNIDDFDSILEDWFARNEE